MYNLLNNMSTLEFILSKIYFDIHILLTNLALQKYSFTTFMVKHQWTFNLK